MSVLRGRTLVSENAFSFVSLFWSKVRCRIARSYYLLSQELPYLHHATAWEDMPSCKLTIHSLVFKYVKKGSVARFRRENQARQ